jgi:hypothetical protein
VEPANNIFPVFGSLHSDEPVTPPIPCEQSPRKTYANDAGLFVVSRETGQSDEPEEPQSAPIKLTCNVPTDLATALYCLTFLMEFFNSVEPGDLQRCADEIRSSWVRE